MESRSLCGPIPHRLFHRNNAPARSGDRTFERFRWSPLRRVSLEKGGVRSGPNPEKMDKRALSGREKDPSRWITVVIRSVVKCVA